MQQSQRAAHNPALEHAIKLANERDQAVVVAFGLYERVSIRRRALIRAGGWRSAGAT